MQTQKFVKSEATLGNMNEDLLDGALTLLALCPSFERGFSTMGYTQSELRSKLSHEKVQKLSFCQRMLKK